MRLFEYRNVVQGKVHGQLRDPLMDNYDAWAYVPTSVFVFFFDFAGNLKIFASSINKLLCSRYFVLEARLSQPWRPVRSVGFGSVNEPETSLEQ
ncbi:hypothetical protein GWI33_004010 [Rhynchophorus ferrugineus]|uniref:Uncharacterized protein n=1 Tax=Rhynchophorus ferrugineus TaxID=354439 RepID=A0A834HJ56_RHYFE|nr:hypothetical protein GWI33_004010 [Rhynchophorus ferrugineus]